MVEHEVVIQEGQSAALTPTLSVSFESVAEDSRCPVNVQCVWAGNARVVIRLTESNEIEPDTSLNTNPSVGPRFLQRGAIRIELVDLEPQPREPAGPAQVRRIRLRWGFLPD